MSASGTDRRPDRGSAHAGGPVLPDALRTITAAVAAAPKVVLLLVLMVTGASVGLTLCYLGFHSERGDLIDPRAPTRAHWDAYTARFDDGNDFVVAIEGENPGGVRAAIDDLADRLNREPKFFGSVLSRINTTRSRRKGLQSLSPGELERVSQRVAELSPILGGDSTKARLDWQVHDLTVKLAEAVKSGQDAKVRDVAGRAERLADGLAAHVANPNDFRSPWPSLVGGDNAATMARQLEGATYFLNDAGTLGLIRVAPARTAEGPASPEEVLDRLRTVAKAVEHDRGTITVSVTGVPALEIDEVRRGRADMLRAGAVAFGAVGLLLLIGFRGVKHPVLALFVLAVGLAWSFGFTTFAVGHLNILSVSFAVILIGLGIDFGIHYLARYLQHRAEGLSLEDALCETSAGVGVGITTAAVTTALAFFCATFTRFLGVAELGIIAGGGVLLCALATFLCLPALIALADEHVPAKRLPKPMGFGWLRTGTSRFPAIVTVLGFAAVIGIGLQAVQVDQHGAGSKLHFDHNLLALRPGDAESADGRARLREAGGPSLLYAVAMADSAEEARELAVKFEALPTVARVEDLARRLPGGDRSETTRGISQVRGQLASLPRNAGVGELPAPRPSDFGRRTDMLRKVALDSGRADLKPLAAKLDRFADSFEKLSEGESTGHKQVVALDRYQTRAAGELVREFRELSIASSDSTPLGLGDIPTVLRKRYISEDGKWLLQIFPKQDVWEFAPLGRFVSDLRTVDPEVTGTPVQNFEAGRQIMHSYRSAALYALAIVSLVLLSDFLAQENKLLVLFPPLLVVGFTAMTLLTRGIELDPVLCAGGYVAMVLVVGAILDFTNMRDAMLALMPPLAGGVMTFGVLSLCGIPLNPTNLIVLPLVLGIGVDDGVHVVHDFRNRFATNSLGKRNAYQPSASTAGAIVLTSLTSMVGFGSLCIAGHAGLFSVGVTLVTGIGCCLFVSLFLLPGTLALLSRDPKEAKAAVAGKVGQKDDDEEEDERPRQRRRAA
ncbi:MMPL family transporter [Alienimonas californiensis]|uniref:MMPL family protein n=1 Tax=Alienimonas californiensis TaxID=2527989 RepID=A0A517PAE3_9PLAN|nr:MMPL family transporter [Alienimonas californiensis]QDT16347.1 MMPL family protein [Alienimonas californiensis]